MNVNEITIVGNVVFDPRFSGGGEKPARCTFRIAHTPRRYNDAKGGWVDGDTTFIDVLAWRSLAEHAVESVEKGMSVLVTGRLTSVEKHTADAPDSAPPKRVTYYQIEAAALGINLARVSTQLRAHQAVKSAAVQRQEDHAVAEALSAAESPW